MARVVVTLNGVEVGRVAEAAPQPALPVNLPLKLREGANTLVVTATDAHAAKGAGIKKCQDETGKWHYGDTAAEGCAKSKVIVITETGTKRKEIAAPPTATAGP